MSPPDDLTAPLPQSAFAARPQATDSLWYKDAVIYQLHVKAFFDADNDGVGDFQGLRQKLDYLQDLGVTALWLLPFYPSPQRDDGYDIAEYRNVSPAYGRLADFKAFAREAHRRNLKIITELVVNHTSDQHPWFRRARGAKPGSSDRNFYVWSDSDQQFPGTRVIFIDTEKSNWAWDPVAQAYYWHRFYSHQPDLNFDNPRVFRAIVNVMRFWLNLGVDGMRLDAVPYLIERAGTSNENLPETHEIVKRLRRELDARYEGRMLLAEANQWPEDVLQYFGSGDECHMAFHFPLMPRIYMAVATEERHPVTDIIRQTPDIPDNCQWAVFLRNHDELTLEMVTDRERDYLWNYYATDPRARLNLGIRRRLAPLMENDRRKIELLNALLISMPGTPVLYYGDEIGMGDNVFLGDRDGVRTPMQWSFDRNGGFSRADPARLYLPPIMDPIYGFEAVNVEAQRRSPSSLLNWTKRLIAARRSRRAFGRGSLTFLYPANRKVIAYLRAYDDEVILCIANLSRSAQAVELDLSAWRGREPVELMGRSAFPPIGEGPYQLTLQAYSFFWFDLVLAREVSSLSVLPPEWLTLVMPRGWDDLFARHNLSQLETEVLPSFLPRQRWFAAKDDPARAVHSLARGRIAREGGEEGAPVRDGFLLQAVDARLKSGGHQTYFLPLAALWSPPDAETRQSGSVSTLAALRRLNKEGVLVDAFSQDEFCLAIMEAIEREARIPVAGGEIRFQKTSLYDGVGRPERLALRRLGAEQSNSSVILEDYALLKMYRRLEPGPHPEIEMARFLREKAGFAHTPAALATIDLALDTESGRQEHALGVLFALVGNQGDGWTQALNYLTRYLDDALVSHAGKPSDLVAPDHFFLSLARQLGIRTGEMHRALGEKGAGDPAFAAEPITVADVASWRQELEANAGEMLSALERARPHLGERAETLAAALLARREKLGEAIATLLAGPVDSVKTRYHGDFHLGQVLAVQNDFFIIDFEGEPARPLALRRRKGSPLRDVAGMIRSFDYAAWSAVRQLAVARPAAEERMRALARSWRQRAVDGFRAAYRKTMHGTPGYPKTDRRARELLAFFTLEKAVYEVSYELKTRPDWVDIPLAGILEILAKGKEGEHAKAP